MTRRTNIFGLAYQQLEREGKLNSKNELSLMLDRAIKIKKWLDLQGRNQKVAKNRMKKEQKF